jgi:hypothetical protein
MSSAISDNMTLSSYTPSVHTQDLLEIAMMDIAGFSTAKPPNYVRGIQFL